MEVPRSEARKFKGLVVGFIQMRCKTPQNKLQPATHSDSFFKIQLVGFYFPDNRTVSGDLQKKVSKSNTIET
jgi:hypothetical protein